MQSKLVTELLNYKGKASEEQRHKFQLGTSLAAMNVLCPFMIGVKTNFSAKNKHHSPALSAPVNSALSQAH